MRRAFLLLTLFTLLVYLSLLSVLANILTGYPENIPADLEEQPESVQEEVPAVLLFKVSPATPRLYWSVSTADYYTGFNWRRTTNETIQEVFPKSQDVNATEIFEVEMNTSDREIFLPMASPNSALANMSWQPQEASGFYIDSVGDVYKIVRLGQSVTLNLVYKVLWHKSNLEDERISLANISKVILDKYLQLPDFLSGIVWELALDLKDSSYSVLDQVLADVQYFRANFVYDERRLYNLYDSAARSSDISSYLIRRKGICIDAATALTIILRIQKIPARISFGYKPGMTEKDQLLYYTTGGHALTEVYLPPYGWVQFDATPPIEENPLAKVSPFKRKTSPGSTAIFQLSITNRGNSLDSFALFVDSKHNWNVSVAPETLIIGALQTADALLEVLIHENATIGEKDIMTVTVASLSKATRAFSITVIVQVESNVKLSTVTTFRHVDAAVMRGRTFWVNGTILTTGYEPIDNMVIYIFLTKTRENQGVIVGKGLSDQGNFNIGIRVPYFFEIGDHKIIAISLGTTNHAPSRSHSIIKVFAATRMELSSETEFLLGYGAIHGNLFLDDGTGFSNAPILLQVTWLDMPSKIWSIQNYTLSDGSFRIAATFEEPGVYEVKAKFSGTDYILGSNATQVVKLKRGLPTIQIFGEEVAVRGEVFNITGVIQFESIRVQGETLTLYFDNQLLATLETRDNGSFRYSYLVDSEETLGSHNFSAALMKDNISAIHEVVIISKTKLTIKVSEVSGGMFLLFTASFSDDHNRSIQGAPIVVDNYGLLSKTDRNGNLTFLLDTAKLWPRNFTLTTRFEGSRFYLPTIAEKEIIVGPVNTLLFLIPLVSPTLVVVAFVGVKLLAAHLLLHRQSSRLEATKEGVKVEEELVYVPQQIQPLKIVLPDIGVQFPNVWGVKDKLRIELELDQNFLEGLQNREVEVYVNDEKVALVSLLQQGLAGFSYIFAKKGKYKIRAILQRFGISPWKAEIVLHVVDYGEEIVRLYNEFLKKLADYGIHARNEMTAREIENIIFKNDDFCSTALSRVTTCFEKADYSNHSTTRRDYEILYLSLKELKVNAE